MMTTTARRRILGLSLSAGLAFMGCVASASPVGAATLIDLVNGNTGTANNTIYNINQSGGTLDLFLAIQADVMEQGYNEGVATENAWNTVSSRDVLFSELVAVSIGGVSYFEFLLSINQADGSSSLTLDNVLIYTRSSAITSAPDDLSGLGTLRYNNDQGAQGDVSVDIREIGAVDMQMYVPTDLFAGVSSTDFVYFYSAFGGGTYPGNGLAEGWGLACAADGCDAGAPVPEPGSLVLLGSGLAVAFGRFRTRSRR